MVNSLLHQTLQVHVLPVAGLSWAVMGWFPWAVEWVCARAVGSAWTMDITLDCTLVSEDPTPPRASRGGAVVRPPPPPPAPIPIHPAPRASASAASILVSTPSFPSLSLYSRTYRIRVNPSFCSRNFALTLVLISSQKVLGCPMLDPSMN